MGRRGEEFDRFVQDQAAPLHRLAYMLCGDWHLADDLVQEALVKCFNHWERVQRSDNPAAYVRRMLINESNRHWRRHRNRTPAGATPGSEAGTTGAEASTADGSAPVTERAALVQALMGLPPGQRAVVVLRHLEDLSEHDTARLLGCSEGTVARTTTDGQPTLTITASGAAAGAPGDHTTHETLVIGADSGIPVSDAISSRSHPGDGWTMTFQVSRVTMADVAAGKL